MPPTSPTSAEGRSAALAPPATAEAVIALFREQVALLQQQAAVLTAQAQALAARALGQAPGEAPRQAMTATPAMAAVTAAGAQVAGAAAPASCRTSAGAAATQAADPGAPRAPAPTAAALPPPAHADAPLARQLAVADRAARLALLERLVLGQLARATQLPAASIDRAAPLSRFGVDSLLAAELATGVTEESGVQLTLQDLKGDPSVAQLAAALAARFDDAEVDQMDDARIDELLSRLSPEVAP